MESAHSAGGGVISSLYPYSTENLKNYPDLATDLARIWNVERVVDQILSEKSESFSLFFQKENIIPKEAFKAVALKCAEKNTNLVVSNIEKFNIADEKDRIEIAMKCVEKCAEENFEYLIEYIKKFNITNEKDRIAIALKCVEKHFWSAKGVIKQLNISEAGLKEIAMKSSKKDLYRLIENFSLFGINDKGMLQEIVEHILHLDVQFFIEKSDDLSVSDKSIEMVCGYLGHYLVSFQDISDLLPSCIRFFNNQKRIRILESFVSNLCETSCQNFKEFIVQAPPMTEQTLYARIHYFVWLASTLNIFGREDRIDESLSLIEQNALLKGVAQFQVPHLRYPLTKQIFDLAKTPLTLSFQDISPTKLESNYKWGILLRMEALLFQFHGAEKNDIERFLQRTNHRGFRDIFKFRLLIDVLVLLNQTEQLSSEGKLRVIKELSEEGMNQELIQKLQMFLVIVRNNAIEKLDKSLITPVFKECLNNFLINEAGDEGLSLFLKTFGSCRNPSAIIMYAANVRRFNDQEVTNAFSRYVRSVFNDSFLEERYSTTGNLHLETVFSWREDLKTKWQNGSKRFLNEDKGKSLSISDWLSKTINVDKQLDIRDFDELRSFFSAETLEEKDKIYNSIQALIEQGCAPELNKNHQKLWIQKSILDLFYQEDNEKQIQLSKKIESDFSKFFPDSAFLRRLKTLIKTLLEKKVADQFVVVDTDDPIDLLLCGTDPGINSCQNVGYHVNDNKGLLGYLMNGKNRLIAVKDYHSGKIVARSIFQLLWDGEKPVLLLEKGYFHDNLKIQDHCAFAILKMAEEKAQALGLELVVNFNFPNIGSKGSYPKTLYSLKGPVPFEYSDSNYGIEQEGEFKIRPYQLAKRYTPRVGD